MEDTFRTLREKGQGRCYRSARNGGAPICYGAMLVSYLRQPFRYFDHIDVKTSTSSNSTRTGVEMSPVARRHDGQSAGGFLVTRNFIGVAGAPPGNIRFRGRCLYS